MEAAPNASLYVHSEDSVDYLSSFKADPKVFASDVRLTPHRPVPIGGHHDTLALDDHVGMSYVAPNAQRRHVVWSTPSSEVRHVQTR